LENETLLFKKLDEIAEKILSGETDNMEEEIKKYKETKSKLEKMGATILDGINFDSLMV
jgi:hypothetical protein